MTASTKFSALVAVTVVMASVVADEAVIEDVAETGVSIVDEAEVDLVEVQVLVVEDVLRTLKLRICERPRYPLCIPYILYLSCSIFGELVH